MRIRLQSVVSQTELYVRVCRGNASSLPRGPIIQKIQITVFLLVTIVSMMLPLTLASLASAHEPAAQATDAVDSNGLVFL